VTFISPNRQLKSSIGVDMHEKLDIETQPAPPHAQLVQMAMAFWTSRTIYVAAKLGLADHLANGPKSAKEVAASTGTDARSLYRVMRTVASLGILTEDSAHRFALTPFGKALQSDAPGSARATILTLAGDWAWRGWAHMLYSVQTGKSGFEKALGMPMFDWLAHILRMNHCSAKR
jgi:Dimerisation domain